METETQAAPASKKLYWTGWVITILVVLMLVFSASMKFIQPQPDFSAQMTKLQWPMSKAIMLGVLELAVTLIYLIPQTAVLGAILVAAYLGGATAIHVRIGDPWFFPVIFGVLAWLGLWLRDPRLRSLTPFVS